MSIKIPLRVPLHASTKCYCLLGHIFETERCNTVVKCQLSNTYLIRGMGRSDVAKVHNIRNIYPYNERQRIDDKKFLVGSRSVVANKGVPRGEIIPLEGRLDESPTGVMGACYLEDDIVEGEENEKMSRGNISDDKDNKKGNSRDLKGLKGKEENTWRSQKEKWREK